MKNQIKVGAIIAYTNIFLNMFISVFMTPFIIGKLGDGEYGVYKIVTSFSAQLGIISFGIASLVARNVVFYDTKGQKKEKENFLFMAEIESAILAFLILTIGMVLFFMLDPMYQKSLTPNELSLVKQLYIFLVLNVAVTVLCDAFTGMIKAHEKFIVSNLISTLRFVLRLVTLIILLNAGVGAIGIVLTDLLISVLVLTLSFVYSRFVLKEKAKFHYIDKIMLRTGLAFSFAICLQAIINQINNNMDNVILGAMKGTAVVTVYSVALTIYSIFNSFVTVIGSMYGPRATKLVAKGANPDELTTFVIQPARIQAMVALLGIVGFVLLGRNFILLWLGEGFIDVYKITLILIIPVVLPLIESVTNTILDAKLLRMTRSLILICMCGINIILSIFLVSKIDYIGAAYGTAISLIVGHGIIMNIYLQKRIGLNIPRMFLGIFKGVLPCGIISGLVCIPVIFLPNSWIWFITKAIIVIALYAVVMYFFGMNTDEKNSVKCILYKLIPIKNKNSNNGAV